jgi:hypothetical protein
MRSKILRTFRPGWAYTCFVKPARAALSPPELLILVGASLFVSTLWLSAYLDPSIRALHFFSPGCTWAAVALSLRRNRWGYFVSLSCAGMWDYITVFVNPFLRKRTSLALAALETGKLMRLDQVVAVPPWIGNLLVVLGSIWAYSRLPHKPRANLARLPLAFALTTAHLAAIIAICQPRYLPLFRGILHPHRPW